MNTIVERRPLRRQDLARYREEENGRDTHLDSFFYSTRVSTKSSNIIVEGVVVHGTSVPHPNVVVQGASVLNVVVQGANVSKVSKSLFVVTVVVQGTSAPKSTSSWSAWSCSA